MPELVRVLLFIFHSFFSPPVECVSSLTISTPPLSDLIPLLALRRPTHPHSYLFYHLYVPRRIVGSLACTFFPPSAGLLSSASSLSVYLSVSLSIQQGKTNNKTQRLMQDCLSLLYV